jgi:hypothetical protein
MWLSLWGLGEQPTTATVRQVRRTWRMSSSLVKEEEGIGSFRGLIG